MNRETARALKAINIRFYAEIADDFSLTRRDPWPGWQRAVSQLQRQDLSSPAVLDLGCGNGRFASFLEAEWGASYLYLGLDSSKALLEHARSAHSENTRLQFDQFDFMPDSGELQLPESHFDLIALFGVLHHVPSFETRRSLLAGLAERLRPGGILIVAAWQFGSEARFQSRILPWEQYNADAQKPIDLDELEPGDYLLRWADSASPRYCHFVDPEELDRLLAGGCCESVCRYTADGKSGNLNLYTVERRKTSANL